MSTEFKNTQTQAEAPHLIERDNNLLFSLSLVEINRSQENIKGYWERLMTNGFFMQLMRAQLVDQPTPIHYEDDNKEEAFVIVPVGPRTDRFGQNIDVFQLTTATSKPGDPHISSMMICTVNEGLSRFSKLAAWSTDLENGPVKRVYFHFKNDQLSLIQIEAQPQTLFETSERSNGEQYLWIMTEYGENRSSTTLQLEAGYGETEFYYKNTGGSKVISSGVRVSGEEVELFKIDSDRKIIHGTPPISLPKVIRNIGTLPNTLAA